MSTVPRAIVITLGVTAVLYMLVSSVAVLWVDPAVTGHTFVLLLAGPRESRPLDRQDLSIVRDRLMRGPAAAAPGRDCR